MKLKLFIISLSYICCVNISAQTYDHIDYSPFIGEWIYESNDTVFKIDLKPVHINKCDRFEKEQESLYGGYSIRINGTLKESCFNDYPDSVCHKRENYNIAIFAEQNDIVDKLIPNLLYMQFYDKEKKHDYYGMGLPGTIHLLSQDSILWRVTDEEKWSMLLEVPNENKGLSVPSHAIMKKVKPKRNYRNLNETFHNTRKKKAQSSMKIKSAVNLDALIGIWKYESEDTIFRIKFQKELYNETHWILTGNYEYRSATAKEKGNDPRNNIENKEICLYARNYNHIDNPNTYYLVIRDRIMKHNNGSGVNDGKITIIDNNTIHWDVRQNHKVKPERNSFSIPTDVIMIREE